MTPLTIIVPQPGHVGEATVIVEGSEERHELIFDTANGHGDAYGWYVRTTSVGAEPGCYADTPAEVSFAMAYVGDHAEARDAIEREHRRRIDHLHQCANEAIAEHLTYLGGSEELQEDARHYRMRADELDDDLRDWQAMDVNDRWVRAIEARATS